VITGFPGQAGGQQRVEDLLLEIEVGEEEGVVFARICPLLEDQCLLSQGLHEGQVSLE